jgi:hypothetical protein
MMLEQLISAAVATSLPGTSSTLTTYHRQKFQTKESSQPCSATPSATRATS